MQGVWGEERTLQAVVTVAQPDQWSSSVSRNFAQVRQGLAQQTSARSVVVLPELIGGESPSTDYERLVANLARDLGAFVVGGSHHDRHGGLTVNRGIVADASGSVIVEYQKRYPFGPEIAAGISAGRSGGAVFEVDGRVVAVSLCADFFHPGATPSAGADLIVVPSFSITSTTQASLARATWAHIAFARSYEAGAFVAIADWAPATTYGESKAAGVAGFADPTANHPDDLFTLAEPGAASRTFDFDRLDHLHDARRMRGFLVRDAVEVAS